MRDLTPGSSRVQGPAETRLWAALTPREDKATPVTHDVLTFHAALAGDALETKRREGERSARPPPVPPPEPGLEEASEFLGPAPALPQVWGATVPGSCSLVSGEPALRVQPEGLRAVVTEETV